MTTTVEKVITVDGRLENLGTWDFQPYEVEVINNPFPGPLKAPEGWDYKITYRTEYANPLPAGAIEEDLEVFYDRQGSLRRVDQAAELELETKVRAAKVELKELILDIQLGLASPEEIERAKTLRVFLKENLA